MPLSTVPAGRTRCSCPRCLRLRSQTSPAPVRGGKKAKESGRSLISAALFDCVFQQRRDFFRQGKPCARLCPLLHDLPEPYKEVFSLRTFGELPFAQIGELFGKTESWARVTYFRARQKLKEGFDGPAGP